MSSVLMSATTTATISQTPSLTPSQSASILDPFVHDQHVEETVYLVLQVIGGQVLLPILLCTVIFSERTASRSPIFVNFVLSWIISSVVYSVFVYRGRSTFELHLEIDPNPCLVQASIINGVQALTSCSTLALIINVWRVVFCAISEEKASKPIWTSRQTTALLVIPYLAFVIFTTLSVTLGSAEGLGPQGSPVSPNSAIPLAFYCIILLNAEGPNASQNLSQGLLIYRAIYYFNSGIALITVLFEVLAAVAYYRNRQFINRVTSSSSLHTLLFMFRLGLFSAYRLVSQGLMIALMRHPDEILLVGLSKQNIFNGPIILIQAAVPLVAFIMFGTQRDIVRVWYCWRKPKETSSKDSDNSSNVSA